MRQKGKEILEIDVNEVKKDFNSAYEDKWLSHYHMKDLVTHEIFEDLLKDEVSDEEDWENFLPTLKQSGSR